MRLGRAPLMPRGGTRHPDGFPAIRADDLSLVWFEEGDGAALLHRGQPFAVVPPWAGVEDFAGYAAEAVGQQSLASPLDPEALAALGGRIDAAHRYWEWRAGQESWRDIQQAGIRHLESRLGSQLRYWAADGGEFPQRAVVLFQPREPAGVSVFATIGMSGQAMPQVEIYVDNPAPFRRIELAIATEGQPEWAPRLLSSMMSMPWQEITWLGHGHTYSWQGAENTGGTPETFLLLVDPPRDPAGRGFFRRGAAAPDLYGLNARNGDPVTYLWVVPISSNEQRLAEELGSEELARKLAGDGRGWVWRPGAR
jgi:hypothetical protein